MISYVRDSQRCYRKDLGAAGMGAKDTALISARAGGSGAPVGEGQADQAAFEVADVQAGAEASRAICGRATGPCSVLRKPRIRAPKTARGSSGDCAPGHTPRS